MTSGFDDEELSMSLAPVPSRNSALAARRSSQATREAAAKVTSQLPPDKRTMQRIAQYEIIRTLGEGSFGKVKLATVRATKQEVALKIISRKKLVSRDMAGRVEREISYLQLLRHPHIIKLYNVMTTPHDIIMVLEYAGGELFDYIVKHGRMPETKARRFFQQIVCAVEYCHRHKIVHRDLKPENLLLDDDLNVKIADFGLSNIMTDGNFLKTSCGSPNYAAPEVISGKLYAGPEVDVWSCGVILYVLLVGRLPFDDDFIPNLFKKINSGNYQTPSLVSSGARNIIHRMLKVNPVQRITVQEIRQDPWFNEDLASYLAQPVEEFIDTGVDPNKAIDPRKLAPNKPAAVQEQIHESVIGKLGERLGYGKDDVQDALGKDEPNAIKDAYLIVRENQIMQAIPNLTKETNPYLAMSPPTHYGSHMPDTPKFFDSPIAEAANKQVDNLAASHHDGKIDDVRASTPVGREIPVATSANIIAATMDNGTEAQGNKPYVSKIGILASSLPQYHGQFMELKRKDAHRARLQEQGQPLEVDDPQVKSVKTSLEPGIQSDEQQAETIRHLKPHSRSTIQLQNITKQSINKEERADGERRPKSKDKKTRWQFGIRSKNEPIDAIKCLYKALLTMTDCDWQIPAPTDQQSTRGKYKGPFPVTVQGATHIPGASHNLSESPEKDRRHMHHHRESRHSPNSHSEHEDTQDYSGEERHRSHHAATTSYRQHEAGNESDDDDIDPNYIPEGYCPKDPWCIKVRWAKTGMAPPGAGTSTSAQSSTVDLRSNTPSSGNINNTPSTRHGSISNESMTAPSTPSSLSHVTTSNSEDQSSADIACFVYLDLQLYIVDEESYLVDFKNSGYEPIVGEKKVIDENGNVKIGYIGNGQRKFDKDVTSPQPFLDLANRLVIHLARGAH